MLDCVILDVDISTIPKVWARVPAPTSLALQRACMHIPVNEGLLSGAFKSKAVHIAVDTGFDVCAVLSTCAKPTCELVIPYRVPVNKGLLLGPFKCM